MRPRLLDLFSGAGGGAMGYHRAGFDVLGVDVQPQPHYPFEFQRADALEYLAAHGHEFDAIHASPPCDPYTHSRPMWPATKVPALIDPLRPLLYSSGVPWIIENVVGAPLHDPIRLCGTMFGLKVFRHRLFESSCTLFSPPHSKHGTRIGVNGWCCVAGHGDSGRGRIDSSHRIISTWRVAMGIDWMTRAEIVEAIPPAYTEFIGRQLMIILRARKARKIG